MNRKSIKTIGVEKSKHQFVDGNVHNATNRTVNTTTITTTKTPKAMMANKVEDSNH